MFAATPIAFVDDDPIIVEPFADEFADEFQIKTFTSPIDALNALPTAGVSLVIADFRMPALLLTRTPLLARSEV